jgi:hypothetical protein
VQQSRAVEAPEPPAVAPSVPAVTDAQQLETLAALYDAGKLTDEEFSIAKKRVLA